MTSRRSTTPATAEAAPPASPALAPSEDAGAAALLHRRLLIVAVVGVALRFVVAATTYGTNDAETFRKFGGYIDEHGLVELYQQVRQFNHPPLAGYWAAAAYVASLRSGLPFPLVFKLPVLLSDLLTAVLVWRVWRTRVPCEALTREWLLPAAAVAAYAWNLVAILVSSFHCNTDSIYAALCLLAVYLLEAKRWNFAAGLAMAAALNVKLVPLVLIPPLLLSFRDVRSLAAFVAGLSVGVVPFLPLLIEIPQTFRKNVLSYRSLQDYWGVSFFLHQLWHLDLPTTYVQDVLYRWSVHGRTLVMGLMAYVGYLGRRRGWDRYVTCAVALALFLFATPGFGLQYTVLLVPVLCAVSIRRGLLYGALMGAVLAVSYAWYAQRWFPFYANHTGGLPWPARVLGLAAWAWLGWFIYSASRRQGNPP